MTTQTLARPATSAPQFGIPRPVADVVREVVLWQSALLFGRDPGATPMGETGWPLSRLAARTYFGPDVLTPSIPQDEARFWAEPACRLAG